MFTAELVLTLSGLALLDAVVTSTLVMTIVVLVSARRPFGTGISYAIGALGSFFLLTLAIYFGSTFMAEVLEMFTLWVRRVLLVAVAVFFLYLGVRRFRARKRRGMQLPGWVNPWTALPFGVLMMLIDLPFSFPMFFAVERLVELDISTHIAVISIAAYTLVSSLPTVAVILLGLAFRERSRLFLDRLLSRFTTGEVRRSPRIAAVHFTLATLSVGLLVLVVG